MLLHFAPGARKSPSRVGAASPPSCWPRERGSEAMVSRSSAPLLVRTRRRACSFVASDPTAAPVAALVAPGGWCSAAAVCRPGVLGRAGVERLCRSCEGAIAALATCARSLVAVPSRAPVVGGVSSSGVAPGGWVPCFVRCWRLSRCQCTLGGPASWPVVPRARRCISVMGQSVPILLTDVAPGGCGRQSASSYSCRKFISVVSMVVVDV